MSCLIIMLLLISISHAQSDCSSDNGIAMSKANQMVNGAQLLHNGLILGKINHLLAAEWVQENVMIGILCNFKFQLDSNVQELLQSLCQLLNLGNELEANTVTKLGNTVANLMKGINVEQTIGVFEQNLMKNKFIEHKNKEKIKELMEHFTKALHKFENMQKAFPTQQQQQHGTNAISRGDYGCQAVTKAAAAEVKPRRQRRPKRMNGFRNGIALPMFNMYNNFGNAGRDGADWPQWAKCSFNFVVCAVLVLCLVYMVNHLGPSLFNNVAFFMMLYAIFFYFIICVSLLFYFCSDNQWQRSDNQQQLLG